MISNEDIGKRIRELRISKSMTIQEMADEIGCSCDHLQKVETGKRGVSLDTLDVIHEKLAVPVDGILYGNSPPDPRFEFFVEDSKAVYLSAKKLYESALQAGQSGAMRRTEMPDTEVDFSQQLTEEERTMLNRIMCGCSDL